MQKDKWDIRNANLYLLLLVFNDDQLPDTYMIPASAWQTPQKPFSGKDCVGPKSKPEYGADISISGTRLIDAYKWWDKFITPEKM